MYGVYILRPSQCRYPAGRILSIEAVLLRSEVPGTGFRPHGWAAASKLMLCLSGAGVRDLALYTSVGCLIQCWMSDSTWELQGHVPCTTHIWLWKVICILFSTCTGYTSLTSFSRKIDAWMLGFYFFIYHPRDAVYTSGVYRSGPAISKLFPGHSF